MGDDHRVDQPKLMTVLDVVRRRFDWAVEQGDKDGAEGLYQQVYELREYMNARHAGKVWRKEKTDG